MTDWARLGEGAGEAYTQLHEQLISHLVRLVQINPDWARKSVQQHLTGELVPDPAKGCVLFPSIGKDVKARLDLLGITPEPPLPEPWFLEQPDQQGWRFKPAEQ